jgi:hypothetical protein
MCALVDALRKKVDDRKNNLNFRTSDPSLKPLDDVKSYQANKSLNHKMSILHLNSPVQGYFRDRKRVDSLSPKGNSDSKGFESGGAGMDVSDVDTEAEDYNDYEDEDDDDDWATWKSTSPNRDQLNSTIPLSPDGKDRDKDRDVSSPKREAAERSIFSRFESPKKVKEIQVFVGSALRSIGGDVKGAVVSVCRGIKENVDVAAAHLHEIELDLRTPIITDASMDSDVLKLSEIKLFVGVSGPYNLQALSAHMQSRGLDHSILKWICRGDVEKYSPALQLDAVMAQTLSLISPRTTPQTTKQHQTEKKIVTGKSTIYESSTSTGKYGFFVTKDCKSDTSVMSAAGGKRMVVSTDPDQLNASCKSSVSGGGTDCDLNEEEEEEINRMTLRGLHFPPVALFHGAKDFSVPSSVSVEMAATLCRWGGEVSMTSFSFVSSHVYRHLSLLSLFFSFTISSSFSNFFSLLLFFPFSNSLFFFFFLFLTT